uniref:Transmembrane protein 222 n=1 Tax=Anolis carolinensis TaxID=28377 RepID=A0A803SQU4_ANOCA
MEEEEAEVGKMNMERCCFPYCIVWMPIPVLIWLFPIIGHMGICTSTGIICDFAGPYYISVSRNLFLKNSEKTVSCGSDAA